MRLGLVGERVLMPFLSVGSSLLVAIGLLILTGSGVGTGRSALPLVLGSGLLALMAASIMRPALPLFLLLIFVASPFKFTLELRDSGYVTSILIGCAAFAASVSLYRRKRWATNPLLGRMALFAAWGMLSALYGLQSGNSREYILGDLFQVLELVAVFVLVHQLIADTKSIRWLLGTTFATVLLTTGWQFYLFVQGRAVSESSYFYGERGLMGIPRTGNFDAAIVFAVLICLYPLVKSSLRRLGILFALAYLLANIVLSFTRGLWLGTLAAMGVALWLTKGPERRKLFRVLLLLALTTVLAAEAWTMTGGSNRLKLATLLQARYRYSFVEMEEWGSGRAGQVRRLGEVVAIGEELRHAPLLGKGLGATYPLEGVSPFGDTITAEEHFVHNLYLAVALRMGIIGLLAFLWILLTYVRAAREVVGSLPPGTARGLAAGFLGAVSCLVVVSMTSPTLLNHPTAAFAGAAMALTFRVGCLAPSAKAGRRPSSVTSVPTAVGTRANLRDTLQDGK